jgi:hypothetical protein
MIILEWHRADISLSHLGFNPFQIGLRVQQLCGTEIQTTDSDAGKFFFDSANIPPEAATGFKEGVEFELSQLVYQEVLKENLVLEIT